MNDASKIFLDKLNEWLQENTKDLPTNDTGRCPVCKNYNDPDLDIAIHFGETSNVAASMNSGPWDACDWQELWRCGECQGFFVVENSNY